MLALRRFWKEEESGQSLLETAIMVIVVFMMVFWVFEICMLIYTYSVISDSANEGLRYAIVLGHTSNSSQTTDLAEDDSRVQNIVKTFAKASIHDVSAISVKVHLTGSSTPPQNVQVKVTYTYVPYLHGLFTNPPSMSAYAEGYTIQ